MEKSYVATDGPRKKQLYHNVRRNNNKNTVSVLIYVAPITVILMLLLLRTPVIVNPGRKSVDVVKAG